MTKLSVCVIAKDEERNLGACLNSVKQAADEIIIVDTGSKDRTEKVALHNGAKVFHQPWENDFSLARNVALDKASGEWVLQIDADERLYHEDVKLLRALIERPEVDMYFCQIINLKRPRTLTGSTTNTYTRLFRRQAFRYEGIVHEQLVQVSAKPVKVEMSNLRIVHKGYLSSQAVVQKANRNINLLKEALKETPDDALLYFTLGQAYGMLRQPNKAIDVYEQAESLADPLDVGFFSMVVISKCACLKQLNRLDEAVEGVESACQTFPDYPDIHFLAGEIYSQNGEWEKALDSYNRCAHMPRAPYRYGKTLNGLDKLAQNGVKKCQQHISQTRLND